MSTYRKFDSLYVTAVLQVQSPSRKVCDKVIIQSTSIYLTWGPIKKLLQQELEINQDQDTEVYPRRYGIPSFPIPDYRRVDFSVGFRCNGRRIKLRGQNYFLTELSENETK